MELQIGLPRLRVCLMQDCRFSLLKERSCIGLVGGDFDGVRIAISVLDGFFQIYPDFSLS